MKFEIGDTVRLIHSGEEGTITGMVSDDMVMVNVGGVEFPAYADQVEYPYFKRFTAARRPSPRRTKGEELPREKPRQASREERGVWLSFLPLYDADDDTLVQTLKIHLVNETALPYRFSYRCYLSGEMELDIHNEVQAFTHFYLQDIPFDRLNDYPRFELLFSVPASGERPPKGLAESYALTVKLKPRQVMAKLARLRDSQEATFSYPLFDRYPNREELEAPPWDLPELSPRVRSARRAEPTPAPREAVDLHIEKLTDDWRSLTPLDILAIQLNAFRRQLDLAIAHRQPVLVVIHGVGKGRLRDEVHEILKQVPEVSSFVNQYDFRYGYGATEIFFRYP